MLKDPNAVLDFKVDWTAWLAEDSDTIISSTWVVPDGITKTTDAHTDTEATAWLSGGTVGTTYRLINRITTTGGRTDDRTITVTVRER